MFLGHAAAFALIIYILSLWHNNKYALHLSGNITKKERIKVTEGMR